MGSLAAPASAGTPYKRWPPGWSTGVKHHGAYHYSGVTHVKYVKKWPKPYYYGGRHYRAPRYYTYKPRHYRHYDNDFVIGLGIGFLGAAILSTPPYYAPAYRVPVSRGWCHVHRYKVRGMTFHRDVRCFKHRNWNSPSILYVR